MDREIVDILSFGACLGALLRALFGLRVALHWCVAAGAAAVYALYRGIDAPAMLQALPPSALEAAVALYFAGLLAKRLRETPARTAHFSPRRFA